MRVQLGAISTSRGDTWVYRPLLGALPIKLFRVGAHQTAIEPAATLDVKHGVGPQFVGAQTLGWPALKEHGCSAVFVVGDRFEMLAATMALAQTGVPIIHIGGGATTLGSQDEKWRAAISRLSDWHLVESRVHANNVIDLGIDSKRVFVVGSLGLANLRDFKPLDVEPYRNWVVVSYHPNTMEPHKTEEEFQAIVDSLWGQNTIVCAPNFDEGYERVLRLVPKHWLVAEEMGGHLFWSVLLVAKALVGNSSAGIIEASYLGCPVVNVGDRQKGRLCPIEIVHTKADPKEIREALKNVKRLPPKMPPLWADREILRLLPSLLV